MRSRLLVPLSCFFRFGFNSKEFVLDEKAARAKSGSFVGSFFGLRRGTRESSSVFNKPKQSSPVLIADASSENSALAGVPKFKLSPPSVSRSGPEDLRKERSASRLEPSASGAGRRISPGDSNQRRRSSQELSIGEPPRLQKKGE